MIVDFSRKISSQLKLELPGFAAQSKMSPPGRKAAIDSLGVNNTPQLSAVLLLLYFDEKFQATKIVFIERAENEKGNHSGQIAFPGGRKEDNDYSLDQTALREAEEEIGIIQENVKILGALTPLFIPVSNYLVHPFVGVYYGAPDFNKHPDEVKDIIAISTKELFSFNSKAKSEVHIKNSGIFTETPCYKVEDKIIWGATAMIVSEFEEIIKRIE